MITNLPYKRIKWLIGRIRSRYFSVSWPSHVDPIIVKGMDCSELETLLRANYGFEETYLSYKYNGECFNLRKPDGKDDGKQMELHVRARKVDNVIEILCHRESSRYEAKTSHIEEKYLSWSDGQRAIIDILESEGVEYDY